MKVEIVYAKSSPRGDYTVSANVDLHFTSMGDAYDVVCDQCGKRGCGLPDDQYGIQLCHDCLNKAEGR